MEIFKKILHVGLILTLICLIVFVNLGLNEKYRYELKNNYLLALADKDLLLKNTPSPKVIIVGGSNVAFGIDSNLLKEKLGMPVVNTGLQGNLGIRFVMNNIKPYLNDGDIVLISPEYHNLFNDVREGEILSDVLVLYPPAIRNISSLKELLAILKALPYVHTQAIKKFLEVNLRDNCDYCKEKDPVYFRSAFDPITGDITTNNVKADAINNFKLNLGYTLPNHELDRKIEFFNSFYQQAKTENIKMFFSFPSIVDNSDEKTLTLLHATQKILTSELDFPVIGNVDEMRFPNSLMFDTTYHLNKDGREIRTLIIAQELCSELNLTCK